MEMKRDIKAIITMLATQSMINLGEIMDPMTGNTQINLNNARVFIDLVEALEDKTRGNLSPDEGKFLAEVLENLRKVYQNKVNQGC